MSAQFQNSNVSLVSVKIWQNISHSKTTDDMVSPIYNYNPSNGSSCSNIGCDNYNATHCACLNGYTQKSIQSYYYDWTPAIFSSSQASINYNALETRLLKFTFKTPPSTYGKFNITVSANGLTVIDPWWDSTWTKKAPLVVNTTTSLTNYQIPVNVTYDADMNVDFSDIRFVNALQDTDLSYWIENKTNSSWAYVWVKGNWSNTNGTQGYVYYKKTGVPTTSNGKTTFLLFDDFNDASFNSTIWSTDGGVAEVGGQLKVQSAGGWASAYSNITYPNNTCMMGSFNWSTLSSNNMPVGYTTGHDAVPMITFYGNYIKPNVLQVYLTTPVALNYTLLTDASALQRLSLCRNGTTNAVFSVNFSADKSITTTLSTALSIRMEVLPLGKKIWSDWVAVRNYTYPEPASNLGTEETLTTNISTWSNNVTNATTTYNATAVSQFNVTWASDSDALAYNYSRFESNYSGTATNYSTTRPAGTNITSYSVILPAGTFYWKVYANNSGGVWNTTPQFFVTLLKIASNLSMTSVPAWTVNQGDSATISCTADIGTPVITMAGTGVTNPYAASLGPGTYNFSCTILDTNYTPTSVQYDLQVGSTSTGCTNNTTYAFKTTITLANHTNATVNFTTLVSQHIVSTDLSDIYTPTAGVTLKKNVTGGYYISFNYSNITSVDLYFGNYFINNTIALAPRNATMTNFTHSQLNNYVMLNLIDELNSTYQHSPNSTLSTVMLYCAGGSTLVTTNDTAHPQIILASDQQLSSIEYTSWYGSTAYYYRDLLVPSVVQYLNLYTIDVTKAQALQYIITVQDTSTEFTNPVLHIYKNIGGSSVLITEKPFDAENKAIIYLISAQQYSIVVTGGGNSRSIGNIYADNANLQKTLVLGNVLTLNASWSNTSFGLTYNQTTGLISFSWYDPSNHTINTTFTVKNYTDRTMLYNETSTASQSVGMSYIVPNKSQWYLVQVHICHQDFGCKSIAETKVIGLITQIINITAGSSVLADLGITSDEGRNALLLMFGIVIMMIPMIFGGFFGSTASIIVALLAILFAAIGVYPVSIGLLMLILILALLNKFSDRRNEQT